MATIRIGEAAEILGVTKRTVRQLHRTGHLRGGYLPRAHTRELRFDRDEVERVRRLMVGLQ